MIQRIGLLGLLLTAGCGPSRAARLEQRATTYVFHQSADRVTLELIAYFEERGFSWDAPRPDGLRRTAWRRVYGEAEFATVSERYFAQVQAKSRSHATVQVIRLTRTTAGMETYHPTFAANIGRDREGEGALAPVVKGSSPLPMGAPVAKRALDVEWDLIRRLEPQRAAALQSRVEATASR